jgi:ribonuclease HI
MGKSTRDGNGITNTLRIDNMRVFTDGACSKNGRTNAKAGFAAWFPENRELSSSHRMADEHVQTNQRAELSAIHLAVSTLETAGFLDEDISIYTDSEYSINCLTKWLPGWISRGWKTSDGKDVLHQDLIKETTEKLAKFKGHRFIHVKAHTGGEDDLSRQNDIVDRMARATIDETVRVIEPPVVDDILPGCPLRLLGPPTSQAELVNWIRANLSSLDKDIIDKHLMKAFAEMCKNRSINLTKQTIQRTPMLRAERAHLQIVHVVVEKIE